MTVACPFSLERTGHPSDHRSLRPDASVSRSGSIGRDDSAGDMQPLLRPPTDLRRNLRRA